MVNVIVDTETHAQTDVQTDRQTQTEAKTQTDRQPEWIATTTIYLTQILDLRSYPNP